MISLFRIIKAYKNKEAHSFSSLQCDMPADLSSEIYNWGVKNIPDNMLADKGRQPLDDIHVTLKYGLHEHDPIELRELLFKFGPVKATLGDVSIFENDKADVVQLGVESPQLHKLNKIISDNFEHTDSYDSYIPHITISYVKSGQGKKFVGLKDFSGKEVTLETATFSGNDNRKTTLLLR